MVETGYEEQSSEISQYNEASLQILRLHEFWLKAEQYSNRGILIKWKFILDSIYRELSSDIDKMNDSKEIIKRDIEIRKKIAQANKSSILYHLLDQRHRLLKEIQDKAGKGSKYIDPDNEDFD